MTQEHDRQFIALGAHFDLALAASRQQIDAMPEIMGFEDELAGHRGGKRASRGHSGDHPGNLRAHACRDRGEDHSIGCMGGRVTLSPLERF
ncbi:hypothetical protein [Mesorhizobium sp.]|uniref:hypothetical protein n=1 Tax=Mesorhizobium sp. TaxID=1871066 RepID=UPI00121E2636|nr:hypothetical protein [Mesorhizobium sp.]TIL44926.1 MAG: hypothetical protein E5Y86_14715 [Mesorhizobium sp.]